MNGKTLTDEEILRFQRFSVTESAAATFTQQALDTQLSIERGIIWLIHAIEWLYFPDGLQEPSAGGFENVQAQITRESKAAIIYPSDTDLIAFYAMCLKRTAAIGTDAGPLWWYDTNLPKIQTFPIPIPFASQNIYVGLQGSNSGAAQVIRGRIYFTIRKVSDAYFYRVAQALIA